MFRKICKLINIKHKISLLPSATVKSDAVPIKIQYIILVLLVQSALDGIECVMLDSSVSGDTGGSTVLAFNVAAVGGGGGILESPNLNLERSIAAVFSRVAYGSTTTTKRSIPDNVYVPSLTTVPTPLLTTFRYREKEKEVIAPSYNEKDQHANQQQINAHHRSYEMDLERDHVLPTSAPNADILKSNSNPTYPNPNLNRHHNHDRHRHANSTPYPSGHNLKKGVPTSPMFSGDMPSYSPPSRAFFTPPLPRNYTNPFADKPTLRGTNSDGNIINTSNYVNRRPLPPPSLMPGHERIPMRPPDMVNGVPPLSKSGPGEHNLFYSSNRNYMPNPSMASQSSDVQRKKALNTPSDKFNRMSASESGNKLFLFDNSSNSSDILPNGMHFPSISRILSGSNGRKQNVPDVLLRAITIAPPPLTPRQNLHNFDVTPPSSLGNVKNKDSNTKNNDDDMVDDFDIFEDSNQNPDIMNSDDDDDDDDDNTFYSTQLMSNSNGVTTTVSSILSTSSSSIIQTMPNLNLKSTMIKTNNTIGGHPHATDGQVNDVVDDISTWTIAWNIHVYLSAILFTILAVYSIFKMIFFDKLTHLFSQSYFISIHLILIIICLLRIFYLCYDAYNIHFSFNLFVSEILLNIPLTFLTITFSILILFLLVRSINHKTNRYSSIIRPLTIIIGSVVHVCICITLHYVESYETQQQIQQQHKIIQMQMSRNSHMNTQQQQQHTTTNINIPPRVLSLICQIIYIFICLSLGILYLYIYRLLKRILQKSQNYIHGYNNLSYAIHITIATALLFILLAALQIYGAISISTQTKTRLNTNMNDNSNSKRTLWTAHIDIDWLQWGYQFSLRIMEIVIITLISWVTGLKTGASKVVQREKGLEQHNASGFALFPCTSSSSQEHFETDYPAVCNANTNLHTYTLRTGKPIYDDNFALNSLNLEQNSNNEFQLAPGAHPDVNEFQRAHETNSIRSSSQNNSNKISNNGVSDNMNTHNNDYLNENNEEFLNDGDTMPDHYENPNFELRQHHQKQQLQQQQQQREQHIIIANNHPHNQMHDMGLDNCYSEPLNVPPYDSKSLRHHPNPNNPRVNYDFQNFERPNFDQPPLATHTSSRNEFRASKNLKALKNSSNYLVDGGVNVGAGIGIDKTRNTVNHHNHYNQFNNYNDSFERRNGVRKSGTLNNIGGVHYNNHHGRNSNNSASSTSSASSNNGVMIQSHQLQQMNNVRPVVGGAQTLSASRSSNDHHHHHHHNHNYQLSGSIRDRDFHRNAAIRLSNNQNQAHEVPVSNMIKDRTNNIQHNIPAPQDGSSNIDDDYYQSKSRLGDSSSASSVQAIINNCGVESGIVKSTSPTLSSSNSIVGSAQPQPQQLTAQQQQQQNDDSMLVAEQGFVRFRALDVEHHLQNSRTNLRDKKAYINS